MALTIVAENSAKTRKTETKDGKVTVVLRDPASDAETCFFFKEEKFSEKALKKKIEQMTKTGLPSSTKPGAVAKLIGKTYE